MQSANDEVIPPGSVYFAQSPHERKATGTHYTTEDLVEKLVEQTVVRLAQHPLESFQPQLQGGWMDLRRRTMPHGRAA